MQRLQNHALFDVQYLCSREVQECLMQPFYTLILIQMNVRNFSKHENKSSYSHQDEGNLLTRRVSQINVYAVKRVFQQSSKLKIAKCLIVHVLSRSYYVTRFELGYECKASEQRCLCVSNNIVLYNVSVNHEWMDANEQYRKQMMVHAVLSHAWVFANHFSHLLQIYVPSQY